MQQQPSGGQLSGMQLSRKGPGGLWWTVSWPWPSNLSLQQRSLSWNALGRELLSGQGGDPLSLLSAGETHQDSVPYAGLPSTRETWTY